MKSNRIVLFLCFFVQQTLFSQNDKEKISLNLLAAPAIPAATLLGFSTTQIDKPRDPNQFLLSLANNSGGFTKLPSNYAVEVSPAWMFSGDKISFEDFKSNKVKDNLYQGMTFSAGVNSGAYSPDSSVGPFTQIAFGLKTPIFRGSKLQSAVQIKIDSALEYQRLIHSSIKDFLEKDPNYIELRDKFIDKEISEDSLYRYSKSIDKKFNKIKEDAKEKLDSINKIMKDIRYDRVGWKLDFTTGIVVDHPNNLFNFSKISKTGVWLTGGYETDKGISFLGIARFLFNPDEIFADDKGEIMQEGIRTFDSGFKFLYAPTSSKFTISAEGIHRSVINNDILPSSWRFTLNSEYKLKSNMSITFSYGRDFDGTVSRDGNVIALLSLFTGFGSEKNLN